MNKPLTMIVKETKKKIVDICNESGLPTVILDFIMREISAEVHSLTERQSLEEEMAYTRMLTETSKKIESVEKDVDSKK